MGCSANLPAHRMPKVANIMLVMYLMHHPIDQILGGKASRQQASLFTCRLSWHSFISVIWLMINSLFLIIIWLMRIFGFLITRGMAFRCWSSLVFYMETISFSWEICLNEHLKLSRCQLLTTILDLAVISSIAVSGLRILNFVKIYIQSIVPSSWTCKIWHQNYSKCCHTSYWWTGWQEVAYETWDSGKSRPKNRVGNR